MVRIDGQTQEYEIIVYQLQLNATEECATYGCTIDCRNDNNQYFRAATAGTYCVYFKELNYDFSRVKYNDFISLMYEERLTLLS